MTEGFVLIHPGTGEFSAWKDGRPRIFGNEDEAAREIANASDQATARGKL